MHLVTVLEDMPVQETTDGIEELRAHGLPVGGVVVNLVRPRSSTTTPATAALAGELAARVDRGRPAQGRRRRRRPSCSTGCSTRPATTPSDARSRTSSASASRRSDVPTYELTRLADGIDLGGLYELAADLREQGMA